MGSRIRSVEKRLARRLGVYSEAREALRMWNHVIRLVTNQISYHRSHNPLTVEIAEVAVKFPIPTQHKYKVISNMAERDLIAWFLYELDRSDIVWDVGANIGMYSFTSAKRASDGYVVAFEPGPRNVPYLHQTKATNDATNVSIKSIALGAENETTAFDLHEDSRMNHLAESNEGSHQVTIRKGDELISDLPAPTVMKIDIEGAEIGALRGMEDILDGCRLVLCEVHRLYDIRVEEVISIFENHGFDCRAIDDRPRNAHVVARR